MLDHHNRRKEILNKPSDNQIIWRYLTIDKLIYLLTSRGLFFSPATSFDDPFEGDYGEITKKDILKQYGSNQIERDKNTHEFLKPHTYISCWYENDHESDAMWKIYGDAVAIMTTFGKIKKLLCWDKQEIRHCGRINYVDYSTEEIDASSSYISYFYKRKSFEHENEVRFLIQNYFSGLQYDDYPEPIFGKKLKLNINEDIEGIVYSPLMESYVIESINKLLEMYKISVPRRKSNLLDIPCWVG